MKLELLGKASITNKISGKKHDAECWVTSRKGSKSDSTFYFKCQNRWISPYEQKLRWNCPNMVTLMLSWYYKGIDLKDLIYPLLALISPEDSWGGAYISVPLKYR